MAKVTITIEDISEEMTLMINIESDPPLGSFPKLTPAQELTHYINERIKEVLESKISLPEKGERN